MSAPFTYADFIADVGEIGTYVAVIQSGIEGRDELFARLRAALRLPSYFGGNWDALEECIRDLSWIGERRVMLFHRGLPRLPADALATYLEILRDAVLDGRNDEGELVVVFAPSDRSRIESVLADGA